VLGTSQDANEPHEVGGVCRVRVSTAEKGRCSRTWGFDIVIVLR
jgi:hypothetical protein